MNLTISGHHLEVTQALRNYVTTKLDRITRHFDQVVDIKVILTVEKQKEKDRRQRAECNIHVKGSDLFAESSHHDLYAAVDDLAARYPPRNAHRAAHLTLLIITTSRSSGPRASASHLPSRDQSKAKIRSDLKSVNWVGGLSSSGWIQMFETPPRLTM